MQFMVILKLKPEHDADALRSVLKEENLQAWIMLTEGVLRSLLAPLLLLVSAFAALVYYTYCRGIMTACSLWQARPAHIIWLTTMN